MVARAARNQADLEALLAGQRALGWLPVNEAVMDRALEVQRLLAAHSGNGQRRPIPGSRTSPPRPPQGALAEADALAVNSYPTSGRDRARARSGRVAGRGA